MPESNKNLDRSKRAGVFFFPDLFELNFNLETSNLDSKAEYDRVDCTISLVRSPVF